MTRPSIIDSPEIGARAKQIAAEELAALTAGCDCPSQIDSALGCALKQHDRGCRRFIEPVLIEPVLGCGLALAPRLAEDDWAALKQALSPAPKFLTQELGRSMRPIGVPVGGAK